MRRSALAALGFVVCFAGCASFIKTEGTSGPIAWYVTDLRTVTRIIAAQPVEATKSGTRPPPGTR